MRWKKPLMLSAIAVVVLILAAYLVLLSLDFNRFKPQIVQAVKEASGLDMTIHGDIDIGFGLDLRVLIHDIDIRNAAWGSRPEMVRMRRCELNLALLRLIRGFLEIDQLIFIEPDFLLETNPSGEFNFQVAPSGGVSSSPQTTQSTEFPLLPVKEVLVKKGRFTYRDGRTGTTFTQDVDRLVLSASNMQSPIHMDSKGSIKARPVRVEGIFGSPAQLIDPGEPWPLELSAKFNGSVTTVEGTIRNVTQLKGLFLKVKTQGPSVSEIISLAGITSPVDLGPFVFHAVMSDAQSKLTLKDIDLLVGTPERQEIKITGTIADLLSQQGIQLDYQAQCKDLSKLAGLSKSSLPFRGPLALSGRMEDSAPKIFRFSDVHLRLGKQELTGAAQVDVTNQIPQLKVELATSELDLGSVLASGNGDAMWVRALRGMGPVALKLSASDPYGKPVIEELDFRAGTDETAEVKVTGSVKDPLALQGIQLFYEIRGKDAGSLEKFIGKPVPVKGPFVASGRLVDVSQHVFASDPLEVALGENRLSGMTELILEGDKPLVKAKLSSPKLDLEPVLKPGYANSDLLRTLSGFGPISLAFTLSDPAGKPAIQEVNAALGADDPAEIKIKGSIQDLLGLQGVDLSFAVGGKDAARLSKIHGKPLSIKGPFSLNGHAADPEPGIYRFEDLRAVLGKNDIRGWVEARLRQDPLSLDAEFSSKAIDLTNVDLVEPEKVDVLRELGPWSLKTHVAVHGERISVESIHVVLGTPVLAEAKVTGAIRDLFAWQGVDLQCSLKGDDPATLVKLTGKPLPLSGAFELSGRLIDPSAGIYKVQSFEAHLGVNDLHGSFGLDLTGKKPRLDAEISSQKLDLRPVFAKPKKTETQAAENKKSPDKVFPADPLPLEDFEVMNAQVRLEAGQILLPHLALDHVSTDVTLEDGHMAIYPLQCGVGGGTIDGRFDLRAGSAMPTAALDLKAERIDIGAMLDELGVEKYVTGNLGADINLRSQGHSISTLMSGLNGRVVSVEREGRIYTTYLDALGAGLIQQFVRLVNPLIEKEAYSEFNCSVHVFDIKDGLATCKTWLTDTKYTLMTGRGDVDLKEEKLDLLFGLSPKKGIGMSGIAEFGVSLPGVARSFKLGGTLARPSITINPGRAAGTIGKMLGGFTLLGPLGLAAGLLDVRVGAKDPCGEVLKELENGTYDSEALKKEKRPSPNAASEQHRGY
jgi:uncharacterized protein involved in outer membrane biogenesis